MASSALTPLNKSGDSLVSVKHTITPSLFAKVFCQVIYRALFRFQPFSSQGHIRQKWPGSSSMWPANSMQLLVGATWSWLIWFIKAGGSSLVFWLCHWSGTLKKKLNCLFFFPPMLVCLWTTYMDGYLSVNTPSTKAWRSVNYFH